MTTPRPGRWSSSFLYSKKKTSKSEDCSRSWSRRKEELIMQLKCYRTTNLFRSNTRRAIRPFEIRWAEELKLRRKLKYCSKETYLFLYPVLSLVGYSQVYIATQRRGPKITSAQKNIKRLIVLIFYDLNPDCYKYETRKITSRLDPRSQLTNASFCLSSGPATPGRILFLNKVRKHNPAHFSSSRPGSCNRRTSPLRPCNTRECSKASCRRCPGRGNPDSGTTSTNSKRIDTSLLLMIAIITPFNLEKTITPPVFQFSFMIIFPSGNLYPKKYRSFFVLPTLKRIFPYFNFPIINKKA